MNTAAVRKYLASPFASDFDHIPVSLDKLSEACSAIEESNDMLLSCAEQFLMTDDQGIITHSYMSTEEALCAMLVKRGILEQISRGKFRVIAESNLKDHGPPQ